MGNIFNESAVNGRKRNLKMGDKGQNSCDVFFPGLYRQDPTGGQNGASTPLSEKACSIDLLVQHDN